MSGKLFWKETLIQFIDPDVGGTRLQDRALGEIMELLKGEGFLTISSPNTEEAYFTFVAHMNISCVLINRDMKDGSIDSLIKAIRSRNTAIPIFVMTDKHKLKDISPRLLKTISGYIWKIEDTPRFIVGTIIEAAKSYVDSLMPPFFKELVKYTNEYKYAWHTPGHVGGLAFLKSPAGRIFYDFFGENLFRSDLSVSVPELGSLLTHTGVEGEAEKFAAKVFGADRTFFVTNGTSTSNKVISQACLRSGDPILLDRNCHQSLQHAITITGAHPVYLIPSRNALGIIGGISYNQFTKKSVKKLLKDSPIVKEIPEKIPLVVVTNSTYDGLIYNVEEIERTVESHVENLHFDEAWYAYAAFHPIYRKRYAMHPKRADCNVFSTQSTHKLLAALSQSAMIHVKEGKEKIDLALFNEAYMMYTSTSPQYAMIASLDVASKMMEGTAGTVLLQDTIEEAIVFRKKMVQTKREFSWWFSVWQPTSYRRKSFEHLDSEFLSKSPDFWLLRKKDPWHGFKDIDEGMMMLDPTKVTLVTPGISKKGKIEEVGIPAPIVTRFLRDRGIVNEKTGFYTFLILFSIGVTKGKSSLLLIALFEFRKFYDEDVLIHQIFPDLEKEFPEAYMGKTIRQLCDEMHGYLKDKDIINLTDTVFTTIPEPVLPPFKAYEKIIDKQVELIPIHELEGRIVARMLAPYPPGIPLIMPGEKITKKTLPILRYIQMIEEFDNLFPGFETDIHGVEEVRDGHRKKYYVHVVK